MLLNTGDRIASHGSVAQVGSPMALYYRPNSLFVAEFIGSPKMNVLPAQWLSSDGQRTEVTVNGRPFVVAVDARTGTSGDSVHLGMRPEDMRLVGDGDQPNTFRGNIAHIEKLGESSMLYIAPEGRSELVTLKVEGTTVQQTGVSVCVQILPELLHLFNGQGDAFERMVTLPS